MKLSNLPTIAVVALLVGMGWIVFDMSRPSSSSSGPIAGGSAGAAIRRSTAQKPVMVEFYADWCGPCRTVGPVVEQFAREMKGKAEVIRVNVDENPELGFEYGVQGIPAFLVFKNGKLVARDAGAIPKTRMRELLGL